MTTMYEDQAEVPAPAGRGGYRTAGRGRPSVALLPAGAACAGEDTAVFFPDGDDDSKAKEICGRCPIRAACYALADARGEKSGVWGGENFETRSRRSHHRQRPAPAAGLATALAALPPMDKAARLADLYARHRTITATAREAGMDPSTVRFYLDLLELHPDTQADVRSGVLPPARAVAAVRSTRNAGRGQRIQRAVRAS
jgi:WhiB family redox-sensing transcriptional regulator